MAQFRLSVALATRSAGRSVVAMAAYRAGSRLRDDRQGRVHDYTRRRGVAYAGIVLPDNAPAWAGDREQLWNRVEEREGRGDAQLAREVQLSLPHELDGEQRRDLALAFARHLAAEYGFAVDVAVHAPSARGDDRNHHAHLLLTSRAFDAGHGSGWAKTKDRRLDAIAMRRAGRRNAVEGLRAAWETMQNDALERAGIRDGSGEPVRVDRRSYERQGLGIGPARHDGNDDTRPRKAQGGARQEPAWQEWARQTEDGREAVTDEPRAIKRTTVGGGTEEEMGRKLHTSGTAQGIPDGLEAGPRDFLGGGRGGLGLHRYRAGRSRQLAAFHAELPQDTLNTDPQPDTDPPSEFGPRPTRSWRWSGLDALNRELSEPAEEERQKERDGGSGRQLRLLDTDPRPGAPDDPYLNPDLNPEPDRYLWGGYKRSR